MLWAIQLNLVFCSLFSYTNHCTIYSIGLITGPRYDFVPLKQHEIVAIMFLESCDRERFLEATVGEQKNKTGAP